MGHFQYFGLLAACVAVTLPLEFIFGFRVWRDLRRLSRCLLPGLVLFSVWDSWAISNHHWIFSTRFTTEAILEPNIPLEEIAFFFVIPAAAISGFEAVKAARARRTSSDA